VACFGVEKEVASELFTLVVLPVIDVDSSWEFTLTLAGL